jgi:hypothetical protein
MYLNRCVIPSMCITQNEYEILNPTTQVSLNSFCIDNCHNSSSYISIQWNIYYGLVSLTNNSIQWTMLENTTQYANNWIFGKLFIGDNYLNNIIKFRYQFKCFDND